MTERISLLVTVKAYPAISQKYGEVVCVAGVRTDSPAPEWVRLFPVAFRELPLAQRFTKYQHVSLEATQHGGDTRPETYRPVLESLTAGEILDSKKGWAKRKPWVEPLLVESMCEVQARQKKDGTSLAAFRPTDVIDFKIEGDTDEWDDKKAGVASQPSLFFPTRDGLEKIPFKFVYRYRCGPKCNGHEQSNIDWELAQPYRAWRKRYDESTLIEKIRARYLGEMCSPAKDTIFFVGNQHQHRQSFMVLGVFWPPAG
jgi:hypothetical protein